MRVQTHESTQTPDPWDLAESLTVKWYNNFHRWWKKWLGFSPLNVGANETELVYTLIHNGNGRCHQQTITTQRSCHRITDVIFNICKKITTVLLLQNLCTCLFFFFFFFWPRPDSAPDTDPDQWKNSKKELLRMAKLLYSFLVVPLNSFKIIKNTLLDDSGICRNRFECIVIFPMLLLKGVTTKNFSWNTHKLSLIFGTLSRGNCLSKSFTATSPLTPWE